MYPSITQPRKVSNGLAAPIVSAAYSYNSGRDRFPPVVQQKSVLTDAELSEARIPFDYVATAVNFIINSMQRSELLADAFREYASSWLRGHELHGTLLTHAEVTDVSDALLDFLRDMVRAAQATRSVALVRSVGR